MGGYSATLRLVDLPTLRAIRLARRRDVRAFDPPAVPDSSLTELVDQPFESVDGVSDRLARLEERLLARDDRRAVFLTIYVRMTRDVGDAIDRGEFNDADWMRRYLISFANYYRRAFLAFERGAMADVPDPWRVAFGTAIRGDGLIIQDAFLGVNAHINYDLALALVDAGIERHRPRRHADHLAINDILARIVDGQQAALAEYYAKGIETVDASLGRFDEAVTLVSLSEGRAQAWRVAVVLTDVGLPPIPSLTRGLLRATATGAAFFILGPPLDPELRRALQQVESTGPSLTTVLERVRSQLDAAG